MIDGFLMSPVFSESPQQSKSRTLVERGPECSFWVDSASSNFLTADVEAPRSHICAVTTWSHNRSKRHGYGSGYTKAFI